MIAQDWNVLIAEFQVELAFEGVDSMTWRSGLRTRPLAVPAHPCGTARARSARQRWSRLTSTDQPWQFRHGRAPQDPAVFQPRRPRPRHDQRPDPRHVSFAPHEPVMGP